MARKLNGDAKVIIERIDNLKEYMKEQFERNNKDHAFVFNKINKHGNSISALKVMGTVGGAVVFIVVGILIRLMTGS